jgi:hypothetical protein
MFLQYCSTVSWTDMFQFFYNIVIQCRGHICSTSFTILWYSVVVIYVPLLLQYCDTMSWSYMFQFFYSTVIQCRGQICFQFFYSIVIVSWTDMFSVLLQYCNSVVDRCFNSFTVFWYSVVDRYASILW